MKNLNVVPTSRRVIENKLLMSLADSEVAAILVNEGDLNVMIEALNSYACVKAKQMAKDFVALRDAAFRGSKL